MAWLTNKKTGARFNTDWLDKEKQIARNKEQADIRNGIDNPLPMASQLDIMQVENLIRKNSNIAYNGPIKEVSIQTLKTMQSKLFTKEHESYPDKKDDAPVVINLQGRINVVIDGNHRIYNAIKQGKQSIKVHYTKHTDYI